MAVCVPVRDMKNTASFTELVSAEGDVTVTKNGYDAMHCLSIKEYELLQEEAAKAKLLSRIMLAESEIVEGKSRDYHQLSAAMRREYGL